MSCAALTLLAASGCGSGSTGGDKTQTLTYCTSQQGPTAAATLKTLKPVMAKFEQQTGIKVKLQVIGWPDLLNRILAATTSGQGPDVLNIGNTWSASLQATGAFIAVRRRDDARVGGKDKFIPSSAHHTGGAGASRPRRCRSTAWPTASTTTRRCSPTPASSPPTTLGGARRRRQEAHQPRQERYGMAMEGGSYTEGAHFAFIFGAQNGAQLFHAGKPDFTSAQMVAGVKQYVDLMAETRSSTPATRSTSTTPSRLEDFAKGKAAMMMSQNNADRHAAGGRHEAQRLRRRADPAAARCPRAARSRQPSSPASTSSVFKNTKNKDGALKLVKFLTSPDEQKILDKPFSALPVVTGGTSTSRPSKAEARPSSRRPAKTPPRRCR